MPAQLAVHESVAPLDRVLAGSDGPGPGAWEHRFAGAVGVAAVTLAGRL
jgi:hypothetical protein